MRTPWTFGILAAVCLLVTTASADTIHEIDYAGWDVTVTDTKDVSTDISDFAYWTGPNILVAMRGDAKVEIPFRLIRSLEIGKYVPVKGFSPATLVTRTGKTYKLEIERFEGQRFIGGKTEFGTMRIRLMQISKLVLKRLSHTTPDIEG